MPVGVVRFDDPGSVGAGWASYNGEDMRRIKSIGDLETSKAWLMDMTYPAYRNANIWKAPHLKRMDYLRVKPSALAVELNLEGDPQRRLSVLSDIYSKTADILIDKKGLNLFDPEPTAAHALRALKSSVNWRIPPQISDGVITAVIESTQESQNGSGRASRGTRAIGASYPRAGYARYLMSRPVPCGPDWSAVKIRGGVKRIGVSKGRVIKGTAEWIQRVEEGAKENAFFFEVSVQGMPAAYARHSMFGNGANTPRRWATFPEVAHLATYAALEIHSGYRTNISVPKEDSSMPDPTLSGGLAAEVEWVSRCLPPTKDGYNPVGAYIRAYDRVACANAAIELDGLGYRVASYGAGRVYLYASPRDDRLAQHFIDVGLMPPPRA